MQLDLFDVQPDLFPAFQCQRQPERPRKPVGAVNLPFLSDIEYLARKRGYCSAGNKHFRTSNLCAMFGKSERTIQRALQTLVTADAIRIERGGPNRFIWVTMRGRMMLQEAGFATDTTTEQETATPTRQPKPTPTLSHTPVKVSGLPRQNVALPRQNDAHISISQSIPVHEEGLHEAEEADREETDEEYLDRFRTFQGHRYSSLEEYERENGQPYPRASGEFRLILKRRVAKVKEQQAEERERMARCPETRNIRASLALLEQKCQEREATSSREKERAILSRDEVIALFGIKAPGGHQACIA